MDPRKTFMHFRTQCSYTHIFQQTNHYIIPLIDYLYVLQHELHAQYKYNILKETNYFLLYFLVLELR